MLLITPNVLFVPGRAIVFSNHCRPGPSPITLDAALPFMRRYLEDKRARIDDGCGGWVAFHFGSVKRESERGQDS
jgi:hypothetical protein